MSSNNVSFGIMPQAGDQYAQQPAGYYPGSTVAGFTPEQQNAWQSGAQAGNVGVNAARQNSADAVSAQNQYQDQMRNGGGELTNDWSQWDNPAFQDSVRGYQDNMNDAFQRYTMPGVDQMGIAGGQMGGSRQGIAQGLATSDFMKQMGQQTSNMYSNQYDRGQDRYLQADMANQQGRANSWNQMGNIMDNTAQRRLGVADAYAGQSDIQSSIGGQQQQMNQNRMQEGKNRWDYNAGIPSQQLDAYTNRITAGMGQGYGQVTSPNPNQTNMAANILGGASTGYSIGNNWS